MPSDHHNTTSFPVALTIAGSDNSGGAGLQTDLTVFHSLGVYSISAVSAVTVQNSLGVQKVHPIPAPVVADQIKALYHDFQPAAIKIGMLVSDAIVNMVSETLASKSPCNLILDPIITSSSGYPLLSESGIVALKTKLIPISTIITPNYSEAETLTGNKINSDSDAVNCAKHLQDMGCKAVVLTGGHRIDRPVDLLLDQNGSIHWLEGKFQGPDLHGTGCSFSAGITAHIARGESILNAVRKAKEYISQAICYRLQLANKIWVLNPFLPPNPSQ